MPDQRLRFRRPRAAHFARLRVLFLLLVLSCISHAMADQASDRLEAIRTQMDKGQGLFLAKDYQQAARVFEEGYAQYPYSAFLFNAGVCYQKMGNAPAALSSFRMYLDKDPSAPDAPAVQERIAALQAALDAAAEQAEQTGDAGESPAPVEMPQDEQGMKSLVIVETEPAGAPVKIYRRTQDNAPAFVEGAKNTLWQLVTARSSPVDVTLDVGHYHVVVEKFGEFNASETDIDVAPGHVHQFRANLSQGAFMGYVDITANVEGASIYLDSAGKRTKVWGKTPHGAMLEPGKHKLLIDAPGYEPQEQEISIEMGDKLALEVELVRVGFGVLRLDADVAEVIVRVDERVLGIWKTGQPALELQIAAGEHEVTITSRGYKTLRKQVLVPRGQIVPLRAKMIEKPPRGAAWTQAVLAAGCIGAGVYFGLESNRIHKNLEADRKQGILNGSDPRINQGLWYSVGADAGFTLGGILGVLSVYNFVKDPYPDPELYRGKSLEFDRIRREDPVLPTTDSEKSARRQVMPSIMWDDASDSQLLPAARPATDELAHSQSSLSPAQGGAL